MLPAHGGRKHIPAQGRADPLNLVGRHGHADTGAADQDPPLRLPCRNFPADLQRNIRIVAGLLRIGPCVRDFQAPFRQMLFQYFFQMNPAVITADYNFHRAPPAGPESESGLLPIETTTCLFNIFYHKMPCSTICSFSGKNIPEKRMLQTHSADFYRKNSFRIVIHSACLA